MHGTAAKACCSGAARSGGPAAPRRCRLVGHAPLTFPRPALPRRPQEELLLWRDPKKSAAVLGGAVALWATLNFGHFNALQSAAYVLLSLVLGCFLWNNLASFVHK